LWNFIIYSGAGSDITTCIGKPDNLQSSKDAINLLGPLVNLGYKVWMHNFYSSL